VGARRDGVMRFRARLPQDTATLLLSASFVIVLVALAVASHGEASRHVDTLSADAAVCLLAIYSAWLWSYLRSDEPREAAHEPSP
jgi:Ca2+/H+ antiporter